MSKEELVHLEGEVVLIAKGGNFRVKLENGHEVLAKLAGKVRRHRIRPSSCSPSGNQRGRPNRVSSIPSTVTGAGSTSSTAPCTTTARCTVGHDTPCAAATSA